MLETNDLGFNYILTPGAGGSVCNSISSLSSVNSAKKGIKDYSSREKYLIPKEDSKWLAHFSKIKTVSLVLIKGDNKWI